MSTAYWCGRTWPYGVDRQTGIKLPASDDLRKRCVDTVLDQQRTIALDRPNREIGHDMG